MRTPKKIIQTRVSDEEYEIILQHAKNLKMQINPYVRRVAIESIIIDPDYAIISQHTREIANVRTSINQLIWTIEASNNYLPKEIATIVELMQKIFDVENKVLRFFTNAYRESLHQMIMDNGRSRDGGEAK